ncbi:hypothetical protein [Psychroserpens luteus]|uniref:Lipoprotein n=1 Tax=Psychroserpens luteus TaxID=1434066 RepID=A0ABW5ZZJ6_9FLAO|nr:hypothetical protein [Psychroserpens luteus]
MKYKLTCILIFSILIYSCKSSNINEKDNYYVGSCSSYRIGTERQITWSYVHIKEADVKLNQVRYCTHNPSVVSQLLYEELGHWDGLYVDKEKKSVIIFWKDQKIEGIDKKFTYGLTSYHDVLSSVIVYDENDNDMLAQNSEYREILLDNFKKRINSYDTDNKSEYHLVARHELAPIYKQLYNFK